MRISPIMTSITCTGDHGRISAASRTHVIMSRYRPIAPRPAIAPASISSSVCITEGLECATSISHAYMQRVELECTASMFNKKSTFGKHRDNLCTTATEGSATAARGRSKPFKGSSRPRKRCKKGHRRRFEQECAPGSHGSVEKESFKKAMQTMEIAQYLDAAFMDRAAASVKASFCPELSNDKEDSFWKLMVDNGELSSVRSSFISMEDAPPEARLIKQASSAAFPFPQSDHQDVSDHVVRCCSGSSPSSKISIASGPRAAAPHPNAQPTVSILPQVANSAMRWARRAALSCSNHDPVMIEELNLTSQSSVRFAFPEPAHLHGVIDGPHACKASGSSDSMIEDANSDVSMGTRLDGVRVDEPSRHYQCDYDSLSFRRYVSPSPERVATDTVESSTASPQSRRLCLCSPSASVPSNVQQMDNAERFTSESPSVTLIPRPLRLIGSYVSLICIVQSAQTGTPSACEVGTSLMLLKQQCEASVCPTLISSTGNSVKWVNTAYKQMIGQPESPWLLSLMGNSFHRDHPESLHLTGEVVLSNSVEIPPSASTFVGWVNVQWTSGAGGKNSMTVPCDVTRCVCHHDANGAVLFVWKLDLQARLSLACGR